MSTWSMLYLQNANAPMMQHLLLFHDIAMIFITLITSLIFYIIFTILINKLNNKNILHNQMIETIWTITPMIILILLAIPSLKILYLLEEIYYPDFTIKTIGHQWYWSYEYPDYKSIEFDSFMLEYNNLSNFRLLDVDNRMIMPRMTQIRLMTTSIDVIHSWTVPSMGVKLDSVPGRINQCYMWVDRPGLYYGQCSEICGMNHSFMPIVIESTSLIYFICWMFVLET